LPEPLSVRAENVAKKYRSADKDLVVFSSIDLQVEPGERLAIVGPSGAGKSTLLHLLGCLDRPSEGRIYLGQREVSLLNDAELAALRNSTIGFVWQMNTLLPEFTALENVEMPLRLRGTTAREAGARSHAALEEVGLQERWHHRPGELSGGEQQRVVLARALAVQPSLLLADEPTGNLDEATGLKIMELLERLQVRHGFTTILVTHNPAFSARCSRILKLEGGGLHPEPSLHGRPGA
jgi:lipoprotein-releasing system ATP-binding protein